MRIRILFFILIFAGFLIVNFAQENKPCLSETTSEKNYSTKILSDPLSGDLNIVFIEFTFPDHGDVIEYYTSSTEYTFPGVYPDGSSIADDLATNGPIEKAQLLGEATEHYFETMSHNNLNVTVAIPRNPNRTDSMWYTDDDYSTNTSRLEQVVRKVYDEFPSMITNASYIVFHSLAYKRENYGQVPTIVATFHSVEGSEIFEGPIAYGNFGNQHRPAVITHEIAHRIEYALDRTTSTLTFPDRGTDNTTLITNASYFPNSLSVYNLASVKIA